MQIKYEYLYIPPFWGWQCSYDCSYFFPHLSLNVLIVNKVLSQRNECNRTDQWMDNFFSRDTSSRQTLAVAVFITNPIELKIKSMLLLRNNFLFMWVIVNLWLHNISQHVTQGHNIFVDGRAGTYNSHPHPPPPPHTLTLQVDHYRPIDGWTDKVSFRVACPKLKVYREFFPIVDFIHLNCLCCQQMPQVTVIPAMSSNDCSATIWCISLGSPSEVSDKDRLYETKTMMIETNVKYKQYQ